MARVAHNKGKTKSPLGHAHAWVDRNCGTCGKSFKRQVKTIVRSGGLYCSKPCNPNYPKGQHPSVKARKANLKRNYGMTPAQYDAMVARQNGKCLLCNELPTSAHRKLYVDHCHSTGRIRGLLCSRCNTGLGMFRENPDALRAAASYLEEN